MENIFALATFIDKAEINVSYGWGPLSTWRNSRRTARALTEVCHGWREIALRFLYARIEFNSLTELPAFYSTLAANPTVFCPLVRSISVQALIPVDGVRVAQRYLDEIITRCLWLKSLKITIDDFSGCALPLWQLWVSHSSAQLSDLQLSIDCAGSTEEHRRLFKALSSVNNLTSLTLSFPNTSARQTADLTTSQSLHLPALRQLSLFVWSQNGAKVLSNIIESFVNPQILSLTICLVRPPQRIPYEQYNYRDISAQILVILSLTGDHLRYLHLADKTNEPDYDEVASGSRHAWHWETLWRHDHFQPLIDFCPSLEHFIAPLSTAIPFLSLHHHPTLKWVDMWVSPAHIHDDIDDEGLRGLVTGMRSSPLVLEGCRRLDSSLNFFLHLPALFPPRRSSVVAELPTFWTLADSVGIIETSNSLKANFEHDQSLFVGGLIDETESIPLTDELENAEDEESPRANEEGNEEAVARIVNGGYEDETSTFFAILMDELSDSSSDGSDDYDDGDYVPSEISLGSSSEYWSEEEDFQPLQKDNMEEYFASGLNVRILVPLFTRL